MRSLSSFAILLVSNALALDVPATPDWPSGRCTDKSLTIPSWIIKDYKVSGGVAEFQVVNRASESTNCCAFITCKPGVEACQGSANSDGLRVSWKKGSNGQNIVTVNDFWYCSDQGQKTIFTASGSTAITSCNGNDCTSPITYLAQGGLTLPVPLTPAQPSPPPGYDAATCTNVGKKQWEVSEVSYKNVTKNQCQQWYIEDVLCSDNNFAEFVRKGQYLSLNVTNKAISHTVQCAYAPNESSPNLPSPLRCTGGKFNEITVDVSLSGAAPKFNLKIEELWYCLEKPLTNVNPSAIVASGSIPLALKCTTAAGASGTPDDIVTTCTDPVSSHNIDGTQNSKKSLPPYSLITAVPAQGGCTFDSVVNPTFYYRGMYFYTNTYPKNDPNSATLSRFSAGLTGPGFADYFFYENKAISGKGVDTVYTCAVYYDGKPKDQHYNCTYAFNVHTYVITQVKAWECRDKNPQAPLYFTGSGEFDWSVDPNFSCAGGEVSKQCSWFDNMVNSAPGLPFIVPKVKASLVHVLPPDYGQPSVQQSSSSGNSFASDTVMINKEWHLASDEK